MPWLCFPKKWPHSKLHLLTRTIHRSESVQVQLKARRKRTKKEKIPAEVQEELQNPVFLACADVSEGLQHKLARDQFKGAQLGLGFQIKVREWQPKALQEVSGVYHWKLCFLSCSCGPKEEVVCGSRDKRVTTAPCQQNRIQICLMIFLKIIRRMKYLAQWNETENNVVVMNTRLPWAEHRYCLESLSLGSGNGRTSN